MFIVVFIVVFIVLVQQFRALPAVSRAKAQPVAAPTFQTFMPVAQRVLEQLGHHVPTKAMFTWIGTHGMLNDLIFPFPTCSTSVIAHLLPFAVEVEGYNSLC